jgi:hypothetical protein
LIKQIHYLTKYTENLSRDWKMIMKSALEFRAQLNLNRQSRKGKRRAATIELPPADESNDDWTYEPLSDPVKVA